jgi:hypothetical protein
MPLLRNYFTDERGITYERTEDESSIEWRTLEGRLKYTYKKPQNMWYCHGFNPPAPIDALHRGCLVRLEVKFQEQQHRQVPSQPQYRLVSRGQSFKTGQEVIELHVYNQSRGIYQKMPVKVTIDPECAIKTLEELENWIKESWGTH